MDRGRDDPEKGPSRVPLKTQATLPFAQLTSDCMDIALILFLCQHVKYPTLVHTK